MTGSNDRKTGHAGLASYLPSFYLQSLAQRSHPPTQHSLIRTAGAMLLVDVSGFSRITSRLAERGPIGAEQLAEVLDSYFGKITDVIAAHGGDVLCFAGDAAIGLWFQRDHELPDAACLATQAGMAVQQDLEGFEALPGEILRQKASVGVGAIQVMELGGFAQRWQLLIAGDAVTQSGIGALNAEPGQVVLSRAAAELAGQRVRVQPVTESLCRVESVVDPLRVARLARPYLSSRQEAFLRPYLPSVVCDRIGRGHGDWLGEFRTVSIVFVGFGYLDFTAPSTVETMHKAVLSMQSVLARYEGEVYQLLTDDKGTTLVACFGLPSTSHEDDASRAVLAAVTMRDEIAVLGLGVSIGVASGRAFCGPYGHSQRRQYSIVGPVINLAARLMELSKHSIACDRATADSALLSSDLELEQCAEVRLKGFGGPVTVFEPKGHRSSRRRPRRKTVVDRVTERRVVLDALEKVAATGASRLIMLEGEAGIGKTCLLEHAIRLAQSRGVGHLRIKGDTIEKDSLLYPWRGLLEALFVPDPGMSRAATIRQQLEGWLETQPGVRELAPLLSSVLPVKLAETPLTLTMSQEARAENLQRLIIELLKEQVGTGPTLIACDDAHVFDSGSWSLLEGVARESHILLVVAARPMETPPAALTRLQSTLEAERLVLSPFTPKETRRLLCEHLKVRALPEELADLIIDRASGHPLFSEELASLLREKGTLKIEGDSCRLSDLAAQEADLTERLSEVSLPTSIQAVIMSRLDRLPQDQLLLLKVASVFGARFPLGGLKAILPIDWDEHILEKSLHALTRSRVLEPESSSYGRHYRFRHSLIQEVAYESLLYAQRRTLHRAAAEYLEGDPELDARLAAAVLAHHWRHAGNDAKAVPYLAAAGINAFSNFANREAVHHLSKALELCSRLDRRTSCELDCQRRSWELMLGKAYVNWSHYKEGRRHLESGLASVDRPVAGSAVTGLRLAGQAFRQTLHQVLPERFVGRRSCERPTLLEAVQAYEGLMEIYLQENAILKCLWAALRAVNLAELAGGSPELARCYGSIGAIVGSLAMRRAANRYCSRALEVAREHGDAPTRVWVCLTNGVYKAGLGSWTQASRLLERAASISRALKDRRRWEDCATHLAGIAYLQGDLSLSLDIAEELYASTLRGADQRGRENALRRRALCHLLRGHPEEVGPLVDEMRQLSWGVGLQMGAVDRLCVSAEAHLRQGELDAARLEIDQAFDIVVRMSPTYYDSLPEYSSVAAVYLRLWELQRGSEGGARSATDRELARRAARGCLALRRLALLFPVARPAAALWSGLRAWLCGHPRRANRLWQRSLSGATALSMPYFAALAHLEIGRHLATSHPRRARHLDEARKGFETLGTTWELGLMDHHDVGS
jgi:class 3 adenylate cyclase